MWSLLEASVLGTLVFITTITNAMSKRQSATASRPNSSIPAPFSSASKELEPLLQQCDASKVYLLHIDQHKAQYKRAIFLIPVLLNGSIGLLLLWRLCHAAPTYWALVLSMLGFRSSASVDTSTITRGQQFALVFKRAALMFLDFLLFRLVGPWPLTFFFERPGNPCWWRFKLGFQSQEVIARVSRGWNAEDLIGGLKKGGESPFFKTRILPAVDKDTMAKTGYLMMDRSWDLDFGLMLDAHTLLNQAKLKTGDLDGIALVHVDDLTGWCEWRWQAESSSDEELQKTVSRLKAELESKGA